MKTFYNIVFNRRQTDVASYEVVSEMVVKIDGVVQTDKAITLVDDGIEHQIEIIF